MASIIGLPWTLLDLIILCPTLGVVWASYLSFKRSLPRLQTPKIFCYEVVGFSQASLSYQTNSEFY